MNEQGKRVVARPNSGGRKAWSREALLLLNDIKSDIEESWIIQKNKIALFINLIQKVKYPNSSLTRNFRTSELADAFGELSANIFSAGMALMSENES